MQHHVSTGSLCFRDGNQDRETAFECAAVLEDGDGGFTVLASCGMRHEESVEFAECPVASRWVLLRAGMVQS